MGKTPPAKKGPKIKKQRNNIAAKGKAVRGALGDGKECAMCVPYALSWLCGEAFNYQDLEPFQYSDGFGFTFPELIKTVKHYMDDAVCIKLKGFPNDPIRVSSLIGLKKNFLKSHKLLVFGVLKDDRTREEQRAQPLTFKDWWHCAAVNLDEKKGKEYWCAYHGSQSMEEGIMKFRSVQAVIAFERGSK